VSRDDVAAGRREASGTGRVSRRLAFPLVGYAFAVTMLGTTLPTPLYPLYQSDIGFSGFMVTVIFAVYAVGVIGALLCFGQLSDQIGRRRALIPGLLLSALSAVVFLTAGGLPALFVGRVLSGLSAGIFTGTATAALVDFAPEGRRGRATLVATLVNVGGLGLGPLLAGLLAEYAPLPLRLPFIVDLALLVPALIAVIVIPEPVDVRGGVRIRLQRLRVPPEVRSVFVPAAFVGFAGFAVLGLFTAVSPAFLGQVLQLPNHALTGVVVFAVFAASAVGQVALGLFPGRIALPLGSLALIVGIGIVAVGLGVESLAVLLIGGIIAGLGQGLSFRAGLTAITSSTPAHRRAEVTSSFFVVLYIALAVPVIGVGLAAQGIGLRSAGIAFAGVVAALAAVTLVMQRRQTASAA
jgi:MFS family permease